MAGSGWKRNLGEWNSSDGKLQNGRLWKEGDKMLRELDDVTAGDNGGGFGRGIMVARSAKRKSQPQPAKWTVAVSASAGSQQERIEEWKKGKQWMPSSINHPPPPPSAAGPAPLNSDHHHHFPLPWPQLVGQFHPLHRPKIVCGLTGAHVLEEKERPASSGMKIDGSKMQ
jgi:hypothetical protein